MQTVLTMCIILLHSVRIRQEKKQIRQETKQIRQETKQIQKSRFIQFLINVF